MNTEMTVIFLDGAVAAMADLGHDPRDNPYLDAMVEARQRGAPIGQ